MKCPECWSTRVDEVGEYEEVEDCIEWLVYEYICLKCGELFEEWEIVEEYPE